jgi:TetR/AcrR family transcriptional repressor of nem operon
MDMLTRTLGVEKPSIYASFGSKHQLYIAALQRYRADLAEFVGGIMAAAPSARSGIDAAVRRLMSVSGKASRKGCFGTNSALELGDHDEAVRAEVGLIFRTLRDLFSAALKRAAADGDVRRDVSPTVLAELLVNAIEGARVTEKSYAWPNPGKGLPDLILQLLDPR